MFPDFEGREEDKDGRRRPGQSRFMKAGREVRVFRVPSDILVPEVATAEVLLETHFLTVAGSNPGPEKKNHRKKTFLSIVETGLSLRQVSDQTVSLRRRRRHRLHRRRRRRRL